MLDDVSLEIASGEFAVLRGASGSGKSTLLNLIGAVDRPTSGRLFLGDDETSAMTEAQLTNLRRVEARLRLPVLQPHSDADRLRERRLSAVARETAAQTKSGRAWPRCSSRSGWHTVRGTRPNELSGGEMQRVAIGRAIVHRPALILADEPTGNLDSRNGERVLELLRGIHESVRPTIVMATHSDRAAAFGDSIIDVADGRVCEIENWKLKIEESERAGRSFFQFSIFNFQFQAR